MYPVSGGETVKTRKKKHPCDCKSVFSEVVIVGSQELKWCKLGVKRQNFSLKIPAKPCGTRGVLVERLHGGDVTSDTAYVLICS